MWDGPGGPLRLRVDAGVFRPSWTSKVLAGALRVNRGETVIDVGCGCGLLGLVAARLGAGRVIGTDVSSAAVACATANARRLGVCDVAEFRVGNLMDAVRGTKSDVVIADVSGVDRAVLAAARRVFGAAMRPVAAKAFPLPDVVAGYRQVRQLIDDGVIHPARRGSRLFWNLTIWCCTLTEKPAPAAGAT